MRSLPLRKGRRSHRASWSRYPGAGTPAGPAARSPPRYGWSCVEFLLILCHVGITGEDWTEDEALAPQPVVPLALEDGLPEGFRRLQIVEADSDLDGSPSGGEPEAVEVRVPAEEARGEQVPEAGPAPSEAPPAPEGGEGGRWGR